MFSDKTLATREGWNQIRQKGRKAESRKGLSLLQSLFSTERHRPIYSAQKKPICQSNEDPNKLNQVYRETSILVLGQVE